MIRAFCMAGLLLALNACGDADQKQPTLFGVNVPGIGDMYAPTKEEKKEGDWWTEFYGGKVTTKNSDW